MSLWDDPELVSDAATYVKLERVGDGFEGTITALGTQTWDDGKKDPQFTIVTDEGTELVWTAGLTKAKQRLKELRPEVGDRIAVRLTQIQKLTGNRTLKHVDIDVTRGGAKKAKPSGEAFASSILGTESKTTASTPATTVPAGIDAQAWANLDDSRRASILGNLGMAPAAEEPAF